jgi:hypothetical protein
MPNRIYKLSYPYNEDRPIYIDDAGQLLNIVGLILQGMGASLLVYNPNANPVHSLSEWHPTWEEWQEFLDRSDDPLIFEQDVSGTIKAIIRKCQRGVSGAVQQKIWYRDGFQCMYCGKKLPDVQLTIDHFVPIEMGGEDEPSNYLSCCRQCNKDKGNRNPLEYCKTDELDYEGLRLYLDGKASKLFIAHLQD